MADNGREAILTMLLIEAVRRLTKNGKAPIHITNGQIKRNMEAGYEVDYSDSFDASDRFILRLVEGGEITVEENVELPKEVGSENEGLPS